ncbi:MAG: MFS transporter [Christensenellaceae bacterium]|nr:MFS transporter [Christensenellaceae bacterium]MEA5068921.1 MFS transporter [Christensenellaceae bacterium]
MYALLLTLIYVAFIGLGLPDSLLGSAWPLIRAQMGVPLSFAGIVSMIIAGGTIVSSLSSDRLTKRFGVGSVTAVSVLMTAVALFGFSLSGSFWMLCVWAIPYGLGAGAVDAALNNYVALHYASRHMNWLHAFWGVGAAVSPLIMGHSLASGMGWTGGYRTVSIMQMALTACLFAGLSLWKGQKAASEEQKKAPSLTLSQIMRIKGVKFILPAFLCYCALETTTGLWASSFLVLQRGVSPEVAAKYASFFFIGIMTGRFLCGFISDRIGDRNMIRIGIGVVLAGILAVWLPVKADWLCLNGLIVIGLGCAPVYPAIIHLTPANFGKENAQAIVGVQMASAYTGSTFMPPLFGLIAGSIGIGLYPMYLFVFAALMLFMTEQLNRMVGQNP